MVRNYEFVCIAQQSLVQNEVEGLIQELSSLLSSSNAKLVKHEYWGLLDLAYPIKKMNKGHYFMLCIQGNVDSINELKRKVKLHMDIVRHACFKVQDFSEESLFINNAS